MRHAGDIYLPKEPKESETAYRNRIARSVLTNIYTQTAETFVGRIFKRAPQLLDRTSSQIEDIADNIDNAGNDIATFATRALEHAVDDGIVYFLVDAPDFRAPTMTTEEGEEVPVNRTRAIDQALGLRPFVHTITAENMLFTRRGDDSMLEMVRYRTYDERPDPDDKFSDVKVEQVIVLERDGGNMMRTVYEKSDAKQNTQEQADWVVVDTKVTDFEEIPLVTLYTSYVREDVGLPLFMDLANLNIRHWQSNSDQSNIVHTIRVPILFGVGLVDESTQKPQSITIAANSVVHGEMGSSLEYVEHTGKAAEVGFKEIENISTDMVRMGTEIVLNQRSGTQTATARALDQAESDTLMIAIAGAIESAFQEIFKFLTIAFGETVPDDNDAGGINLNKDFNIATLDSNVIAQVTQIWSAGGLSRETMWGELQRYGLLSEDFDPATEADRISANKDESLEREARMMQLVAESATNPDETEAIHDDTDE